MKDERLMKILLAPHISEKSTNVAENLGQYVFAPRCGQILISQRLP